MAHLFPLFPLFLDLAGRPVVLLSGEAPMAPLAQRFLEGGAGVRVIAPNPSYAVQALAPALRLVARRWTAADLRGAALVVAGPDEPRPARARASAKGARAVFHMLGGPEFSDGVLGDVTLGGPMTIGLATTTLPEGLARALRKRVADAAPDRLSSFFAAAARADGLVVGAFPDAIIRDRFWATTLAKALKAKGHGEPIDWDMFIDAAVRDGAID
jgi:uroporphyrin-III C-methyltransferase / precorrin-2 dehydrogenase / sirohydrochlorin ferrochelatase